MKKFGISILLILWSAQIFAQQNNMIRVNIYDNTVSIYHNNIQAIGHGFNIYRDGNKLNDQPVSGIIYPDDLPQALGDDYDKIQDILNTDAPQSTFFKLRTDRYTGRLSSFLFPSVAKALGQVFIDTNAPIGQSVNYRIEFVNDQGIATGEYLEEDVKLEPLIIQPPTDLRASNKGRLVTIKWKYPSSSRKNDDQVIQFRVYRKNENQDELLNEEIIVRNNAITEFQLMFDAIEMESVEEYFVTAVDIAGHESEPSQLLRYRVIDNMPPQQISGVNAYNQGSAIMVSWNTVTESDLAGYHIYRSERMNRGYQRITDELLDPLQTYFADSSIRQGKNFSYKITAVDQVGNEGPQSLAAMARIQDLQPPEAVERLSVIYTGENIELSWSPVTNQNSFRSYVLLRKRLGSGNKSYARLNQGDLREANFVDRGQASKGFLEGANYEYAVLAIDSANNFSDTTKMTIQIPDLTAPDAPTNLKAKNHDGIRVELNWDASNSADAQTYYVYRESLPGDKEVIMELDKSVRMVRDSKVEKGQRYIYSVTTMDSLGNESLPTLSDTILLKDSDPPRQVRNVRINGTENGTLISWEPVPGFDLSGYRVYKAEIATGRYQLVSQVAIETTEYIDMQSKPGVWYRVRVLDTSGNESKPSEPQQYKEMQP